MSIFEGSSGRLRSSAAGLVIAPISCCGEDGIAINYKKTQRLSREEGLAERRRNVRKREVNAHAPAPVVALEPRVGRKRPSSLRYEFVHDQLASGRRFRVLTVVGDVTPECLAAVPDTSICGKQVVREPTDLIACGQPSMIVNDNGTELTLNAVPEWC